MTYIFKPRGVCSSRIELELEGKILKKVNFYHGCDGNSQGISKLVEGMSVDEIKKRLSGIRCEGKPTSCPDQLAKAVEEAYKAQLQS